MSTSVQAHKNLRTIVTKKGETMPSRILAFISTLFISYYASAVGVSNISQNELNDITKETGAGFKHTSVDGAAGADRLWAYELGLIGGSADTRELRSLMNESDTGEFSAVPRFGLIGALSFGHGLSGEIYYMPKLEGRFTVNSQSLALKWNFSRHIQSPYEFAIKAYTGQSQASWTQSSGFDEVPMSYEQNFLGTELQISRQYGLFQPYANLGYLMNTGKLSSTGISVFDPAYTTANSAEEKASGATIGVGVSTNLVFMKFSAEVASTFGTLVSAFKASASF